MSCITSNDPNTYSIVPNLALTEDSYTVSYDIVGDRWASFHDYVPDFSLLLRNRTLLQFLNKGMYQMNVGMKGSYFGMRYASYITPVFSILALENDINKASPFRINSITWNTDIEKNDTVLLEENWNTISIHNSYQGTQDKQLIPFKDSCTFEEQYGIANLRRLNTSWSYNYAFNEKNLESPKTWKEVMDQFYIVNTRPKDCNEEEFYNVPLTDMFAIIKLGYNNVDNKNLFFYELDLDLEVIKR